MGYCIISCIAKLGTVLFVPKHENEAICSTPTWERGWDSKFIPQSSTCLFHTLGMRFSSKFTPYVCVKDTRMKTRLRVWERVLNIQTRSTMHHVTCDVMPDDVISGCDVILMEQQWSSHGAAYY